MRGDNDNIAPGNVYTLDEAAAHLRLTNRGVAKLARRHGLCMVTGRDLLFEGKDIEAIRSIVGANPSDDMLWNRAAEIGFDLEAFMRTPIPHHGEGDTASSVYVIQCREFVKIGFAKDPIKRLSTIQIANPYTLEFVHSEELRSITYAGIAERAAHRLLVDHMTQREWFMVNPEAATKVVSVTAAATRELAEAHDLYRSTAA